MGMGKIHHWPSKSLGPYNLQWTLNPMLPAFWLTSVVKRIQSRCFKTEPCGGSQCSRRTYDHSPPNTTTCVLLVKMPKGNCSLCMRISWTTVSDAALRSRSSSNEPCPESAASRMPEITLFQVDWPDLHADGKNGINSHLFR